MKKRKFDDAINLTLDNPDPQTAALFKIKDMNQHIDGLEQKISNLQFWVFILIIVILGLSFWLFKIHSSSKENIQRTPIQNSQILDSNTPPNGYKLIQG